MRYVVRGEVVALRAVDDDGLARVRAVVTIRYRGVEFSGPWGISPVPDLGDQVSITLETDVVGTGAPLPGATP